MADQYYYEDGYIESGYYGYVAEAVVSLSAAFTGGLENGSIAAGDLADTSGYFLSDYIESGYFVSGVTHEGAASLAVAATVSVDATRAYGGSATLTTEVGVSATPYRIIVGTASFGALFSPTLTVNVRRVGDALLESNTSLESTVNKTVDTGGTLANIVNLSLQGVKITDTTSALDIAAALTAEPQIVQLASATLSTQATTNFSGYVANRRPRQYIEYGTVPFTTTHKFGTHSLTLTDSKTDYYQIPASDDLNEWVTLDFWFYPVTWDGATGSMPIIRTETESSDFWAVSWENTRLAINTGGSGNYRTNTYSFSGWTHIRILRGATWTVWINGVKDTPYTTETVTMPTTADNIVLGKQYSYYSSAGTTFYIDELLITDATLTSSGTSSFTPPTERWKPTSQSQIQLLSHYDNTAEDDMGVWAFAAATLSSEGSLTAIPQPLTKYGSSSLTVTATQSDVDPVKYVGQDATLNTAFTLNVSETLYKNYDANLSTATTVTTTANATKPFSVSIDSLFTPTLTVNAILRPDVYLESAFNQTTSAVKTVEANVSLESQATQSVDGVKTAGVDSTLSSSVSVSVDGGRLVGYDASLSTSASIAATTIRIHPGAATLDASGSVTVTATRIQQGNATISSAITASIDTDISVTRNPGSTTMESAATVTSVAYRIQQGASTISSSATQSATVERYVGITATLASQFSQSSSPVKTVDGSSTQNTLFDSSITARANLVGLPVISSEFGLSCAAGVIRASASFKPTVKGAGFASYLAKDLSHLDDDRYDIDTGTIITFWAKLHGESDLGIINNIPMNITDRFDLYLRSGYHKDTTENRDYPNDGKRHVQMCMRVARPSAPPAYFEFDKQLGAIDDEWHHYMVVFKAWTGAYPAYNEILIYVDGEYNTSYSQVGPLGYGIDAYIKDEFHIGEVQYRQFSQDSYTTTISDVAGSSIAQLWVGDFTQTYTNTTELDQMSEFYNNGYVEFDEDGNTTSYSPDIYELFGPDLINSTTLTPSTGDLADFVGTEPLYGTFGKFRLSVRFIGVFQYTCHLDAQFSVSCEPTKVVNPPIEFDAISSVALVTGGGLYRGILDVDSAFTSDFTVVKTTDVDSTMSVAASIVAASGYELQGGVSLSSSATMTVDGVVIPPIRTSASLSTAATMSVDANSFSDRSADLPVTATLTIEPTKIDPIRTSASLSANFTMPLAIVGSIEQFATLVVSAGTLTADAVKRVGPSDTTLPSTATLTVQPTQYKGTDVTLSALYATLTVGDVINLDPYLTLVIEPETRGLRILPESRLITIDQETRINIL